jgi:hypothetical protein
MSRRERAETLVRGDRRPRRCGIRRDAGPLAGSAGARPGGGSPASRSRGAGRATHDGNRARERPDDARARAARARRGRRCAVARPSVGAGTRVRRPATARATRTRRDTPWLRRRRGSPWVGPCGAGRSAAAPRSRATLARRTSTDLEHPARYVLHPPAADPDRGSVRRQSSLRPGDRAGDDARERRGLARRPPVGAQSAGRADQRTRACAIGSGAAGGPSYRLPLTPRRVDDRRSPWIQPRRPRRAPRGRGGRRRRLGTGTRPLHASAARLRRLRIDLARPAPRAPSAPGPARCRSGGAGAPRRREHDGAGRGDSSTGRAGCASGGASRCPGCSGRAVRGVVPLDAGRSAERACAAADGWRRGAAERWPRDCRPLACRASRRDRGVAGLAGGGSLGACRSRMGCRRCERRMRAPRERTAGRFERSRTPKPDPLGPRHDERDHERALERLQSSWASGCGNSPAA